MTNGTRRRWGVSVTPRPLFIPGTDPVPIVQEAGWAPGPVWTGAEHLVPTGIGSPDRPACSQSLYRLRYPAHRRTQAWCIKSTVFNDVMPWRAFNVPEKLVASIYLADVVAHFKLLSHHLPGGTDKAHEGPQWNFWYGGLAPLTGASPLGYLAWKGIRAT